MEYSASMHAGPATVESGVVRVAIRVAESIDAVWSALSNRNEISYSFGTIVEPAACDDINFGVFVTSFRPLSSLTRIGKLFGDLDQPWMVAGWTDFFGRLQRFLITGEPERYEWREDIDGSVNLPKGDFAPLETDLLYWWLPIVSNGSRPRWSAAAPPSGRQRGSS